MKRIFSFLLAALAAAALTGCGGAESSSSQAAPNSAADNAAPVNAFRHRNYLLKVDRPEAEFIVLDLFSHFPDLPGITGEFKDVHYMVWHCFEFLLFDI